MRDFRKLLLFAIMLFWWGNSAKADWVAATCWCEIATSWSDGTRNVVQGSLTGNVGKVYNWCEGDSFWYGSDCDKNRADCSTRCNRACSDANSQSFADRLCAIGVANGTVLKCYSHVGTKEPQTNQTIGTLTNIAAVSNTVCTCPKPWSNGNNVVGGTTGLDKECKIQVCSPITPGPGTSLPPNETYVRTGPITWWTWGNSLVETAPVATCVTTQVSPAQCKLN